MKELNL